jgi:hypothetical protein
LVFVWFSFGFVWFCLALAMFAHTLEEKKAAKKAEVASSSYNAPVPGSFAASGNVKKKKSKTEN